ncbi:putative cyclin-dependent serine/threonine-protein kinase DDB_G0272797/DDB_G0274007 [Gigantopelta aegis]|uniref:putative cyclin-dependent serine/threonine-protein kinase DDB_G0272797/DDB_G0274007 n=1 Tax=Gigantopelta aegis TaxID=1735272 RepID=UPI001B888943|nr:putative cyclin-dependent serine/threonine-protein kinase DDB_G0272797/DDB_G0274007 [Gigantopelta aegis]
MPTPTTRAETDEPVDNNLKTTLLAVIVPLVVIVAVIGLLIHYRRKIAQIMCSWRQTLHEVIGHDRRDAGPGVIAHDHQPHNLEPVDMLNLERQDEEISNGVGADQSRAVFRNAQESKQIHAQQSEQMHAQESEQMHAQESEQMHAQESEQMHEQETDKMLEEQSEQTSVKY